MTATLSFCLGQIRGPQFIARRWLIAVAGMATMPATFGAIISGGEFFSKFGLPLLLISLVALLLGTLLFPFVLITAIRELRDLPLGDSDAAGEVMFAMPGCVLGVTLLFGLMLGRAPTPAVAFIAAAGATTAWAALFWWGAS